MRVMIEIETNGAAFVESPISEFRRVLDYVFDNGKNVAEQAVIDDATGVAPGAHVAGFAADTNGNRIATWEVTA